MLWTRDLGWTDGQMDGQIDHCRVPAERGPNEQKYGSTQ